MKQILKIMIFAGVGAMLCNACANDKADKFNYLLDDEGKMKGSVLILDFDSKEKLDAYLASEPYIAESVWETVTVERMNVVLLNGEKVGQ